MPRWTSRVRVSSPAPFSLKTLHLKRLRGFLCLKFARASNVSLGEVLTDRLSSPRFADDAERMPGRGLREAEFKKYPAPFAQGRVTRPTPRVWPNRFLRPHHPACQLPWIPMLSGHVLSMRCLTCLLCVFVLLAPLTFAESRESETVVAANDLAFKGDKLGSNLASFVTRYLRTVEGAGSYEAPFTNFGSVFAGQEPQGKSNFDRNLRKTGTVEVLKQFPFETRDSVTNDTISGVAAYVSFTFYAETFTDWDVASARHRERRKWTEFEEQHAARILLGCITARFSSNAFEAVARSLVEKYGEPTNSEIEALQNRMGATFSAKKLTWTFGDDAIIAWERSGTIDDAVVMFARFSVMRRSEVLAQIAAKSAAADL